MPSSNLDTQTRSELWDLADGVTYLNHGSFGLPPRPVLERREALLRELAAEPMDFFIRQLSDRLEGALQPLADLLHCSSDDLVFVPNATAGMNIVVANLTLGPDDEVLLTDHEYGAVVRIWERACRESGARLVTATLPRPVASVEEVVDAVFEQVTDRTKLLVFSHVTSQTAVILPVRELCARARERGVLTCIDAPHAPVQVEIDLKELEPDFYMASCHKWLSAPFGTGFLYVSREHQPGLRPTLLSWGRSLRGAAPSWKDEFHWPGTFDPTPYLTIPTALECIRSLGIETFRERTHALARYARQRLLELSGEGALTADDPRWYPSMVTVPFESLGRSAAFPGDIHPFQKWVWERHRIEVPVIGWQGKPQVRVSCHLYNSRMDIDRLIDAVNEWRNMM